MAALDFSHITWLKSTRSGNSGGACLEIAFARGAVGMRDSKDQAGPVLAVEPGAWSSFIDGVRSGDFG